MKIKSVNWKNTAMKLAGVFAGVVAGGACKKALNESNAVEGLAGDAKNYLVPAVLAVGGAVLSASVNDDFIKNAGFGITAVGGASIVNEAMGKEVITLNGVRGLGRMPRRIPAQGVVRGVRGMGIASLEAGMSGTGLVDGCF